MSASIKALRVAIQTCEIPHPAYVEHLKPLRFRIDDALDGAASRIERVMGPSRVGKSMLINTLQRDFPETRSEGRRHVPLLVVRLETGVSPKLLPSSVLKALGLPVQGKLTSAAIYERMVSQLKLAGTRVLIFEEASHLVDHGSRVPPRAAADWFKSLAETLDLTLLMFGVPRLERLYACNEQLRLRASAPRHFLPYDSRLAGDMQAFHTCVATYAPHQDESSLGYYRRLAADNMLSDWRELAELVAGAHSRSALLQADASVLADLLGLEPAWTHAASQQEARTRVWGVLHRLQGDAVCPVCLAQSGHLRHAWEHAYVTACPQHRIQLVDRCDVCGEWLSPHRTHIDRCACGHDLRELPRVPSSPAQHWLSALIGSAGRTSGGIAPTVKGVDIPALASLVRTLCRFADPTQPALRQRATAPRSVAEAVELLAPLEPLLADWPAGFEAHVAQRIAVGKPEARTLNMRLGPWYIELRKRCQGTALEPLLQVVIDVAAVQFDGILGLDSAKTMAQDATEHMRASDAAKAIGVSVSRLQECLPTGVCAYRTRRLGTRGMVYEIPRVEVARIQQQRSEWISSVEACELAGVSPSVLSHMMAADVIRADVNWRHDLLKGGPVERRSLLELFERVREAAEPGGFDGNDETLTWAGLTSRRMGDKQAIQSAMRAIAEGQVKAVVCGRRLGDMVFLRTDVAEYFGTPLLEAGLSIQQLAKTTGWKWESIAYWIDSGLLASETIRLRGKPCRVVLPHQLLAFRQAYLPLADLARGMGTKSSALAKLLSGVSLVGARPLPGGASRGGLIPVAQLGRLAVLGARAGQDLFVSDAPFQ